MGTQTHSWEKVISFFSKILIISGILLVSLSTILYVQHYSPYRLSFKNTPQEQEIISSIKEMPTRISITGTPIDLPISPATIDGQEWETSTTGVSYLSQSPIPGSEGNSILYGHNWTHLLGPLVKVKPGQIIEITYSDNSKRQFEVEHTIVVQPDDTSVLLPSKEPLITIYTCTGFLDSKRFVVTAKPIQG